MIYFWLIFFPVACVIAGIMFLAGSPPKELPPKTYAQIAHEKLSYYNIARMELDIYGHTWPNEDSTYRVAQKQEWWEAKVKHDNNIGPPPPPPSDAEWRDREYNAVDTSDTYGITDPNYD